VLIRSTDEMSIWQEKIVDWHKINCVLSIVYMI